MRKPGDVLKDRGKTLEKKRVLKYNCIAMDKINNVHDKFFSKTYGDPENVKDFLKSALPEPIGNAIDLSKIEIDNSHYVSNESFPWYFTMGV